MPSRPYSSTRRTERQADTRERIVAATVALHEAVGPARTRLTDVARRAGVDRVTIYRHFPDPALLLKACAQHFLRDHPLPDPDSWLGISEPRRRLEHGLHETYAYYRANRRMVGSILRDSEVMPVGLGFLNYQARAREALGAGWTAKRTDARAATLIRLAVGFDTWRRLTEDGRTPDGEAAALMAGLIAR